MAGPSLSVLTPAKPSSAMARSTSSSTCTRRMSSPRAALPTDESFRDKVRVAQSHRRGLTLEQYIEKMDRAGIERSFLIAVRCGDLRVRGSMEIPYAKVHDAVQRYPHRFSGLAGIDPTRGIAGLKELDHAVKEYGFVGAHLYPHWFGQGAGRRDLLSVLRALRRAWHSDHDAGRSLPGLSEGPAAAVSRAARSRSTGSRSIFPS